MSDRITDPSLDDEPKVIDHCPACGAENEQQPKDGCPACGAEGQLVRTELWPSGGWYRGGYPYEPVPRG